MQPIVDKPNFRVSLPHRRSTTVSLETNPLYSIVGNSLLLDWTTLNITKKRNENITLKEIIITFQNS